MATCSPSELLDAAKCFECLSKQELQAVIAQLLCNINAGGGGNQSLTIGAITPVGGPYSFGTLTNNGTCARLYHVRVFITVDVGFPSTVEIWQGGLERLAVGYNDAAADAPDGIFMLEFMLDAGQSVQVVNGQSNANIVSEILYQDVCLV